ncbi:hypothetical protein [Paenibacillus sp. N3.4]|uniref:hypothetical protein n=1 Tax=Paenibacillus sp. N3.4 TaxID=2603222 RepID=UPI0011CACAAE|nr:hypothetical protein [Paenibacillus sp. N3.4]TXK83540.1 hypothetical protein FU659_13260 [Paenibacillus sp. N3.4]
MNGSFKGLTDGIARMCLFHYLYYVKRVMGIAALDTDLGTFFKFNDIEVTSSDFDKQSVLEIDRQFKRATSNWFSGSLF